MSFVILLFHGIIKYIIKYIIWVFFSPFKASGAIDLQSIALDARVALKWKFYTVHLLEILERLLTLSVNDSWVCVGICWFRKRVCWFRLELVCSYLSILTFKCSVCNNVFVTQNDCCQEHIESGYCFACKIEFIKKEEKGFF